MITWPHFQKSTLAIVTSHIYIMYLSNQHSTRIETMENRIYVGTYAAYNAGSLRGAWLELDDYNDAEEFYDAARELHKGESDPEFMFQDYETDFTDLISEDHVDPLLWDIMAMDDHEILQVKALLDEGYDTQQAIDDKDNVTVVPCDYKHEAAKTFFDEIWCEHNPELVELLDNALALAYLDQDAIWRDAHDWHFIDGIGLVNTSF